MTDLLELFQTTINQKAKDTVSTQLNGTLVPVELGSQGDLPWFWQDSNDNFNKNTFDWLSRRVTPGQRGGVSLPDSFVNAWDTVLNDLTYSLSTADQAQLNSVLLKATTQSGAVVRAYEQQYGAITSDDLQEAGTKLGRTPSKVDYVIGYAAGYLWSGAATATPPQQPTTYVQMSKARNFDQLFPNQPSGAQGVITAISAYLAVTNSVLSLQDASSNAIWKWNQLKMNTETPTTDNGGMNVIDSQGNKSVRVGYSVAKSVTDISNGFDGGMSFTVGMTAQRMSADQLSVNINGSVGVSVPIAFVSIDVDAEASYSLFEASGSGSSANISMKFDGVQALPTTPNEWQADSDVGWILESLITEAVQGTGQDVTGWKFSPKPTYDFSAGGDFGELQGVVISNYPTIEITYTQGDYSAFSKVFSEAASLKVKLFGIPLGGASNSVYSSSLKSNSTDGSFTLTMTPPPQVSTVNALDQRAYTLSAAVKYPGAAAPKSVAAMLAEMAGPMVKLGGVTFLNQCGQAIEIYSMAKGKTRCDEVRGGRVSPTINGTLLNIDVLRGGERYSYDMHKLMPGGLLVADESPYRLKQVLGHDGRTLELVMTDNDGEEVGSFAPSGVLA